MPWYRTRETILGFGVLLVGLGGWLGWETLGQHSGAVVVEAEVEEVRTSAIEHRVGVRFEDLDGEDRTAFVGVPLDAVSEPPTTGDELTITYFDTTSQWGPHYGEPSLRDWLWPAALIVTGVLLAGLYLRSAKW